MCFERLLVITDPRNLAHISGKMPISPEVWSPDSTDKKVQITTARGDFKYETWEHYDKVHPILLDATAVPSPGSNLGTQSHSLPLMWV